MINPQSNNRRVKGITETQVSAITSYLRGAVYCWCATSPQQPFAARNLVGGVNFEWQGTPLYPLFEKHIAKGKSIDAAIKDAGRDLGHLLKRTVLEDKRSFQTYRAALVRHYRWVGDEA